MGPTDPRYTETGYEIGKVIREEVDCSPCHIKTCPTDHQLYDNDITGKSGRGLHGVN